MAIRVPTNSSSAERADDQDSQGPREPERVVYLLGAGATHGSIRFGGSMRSLVMPGLSEALSERMHERYQEKFTGSPGIERLVNEVVANGPDFEHLITFLEDTPSDEYKRFSDELKLIFSSVLRTVLDEVRVELQPHHSELYAALLDMHAVEGLDETLVGFLTLNYDAFLEHAIEERLGCAVDYGIHVEREPHPGDPQTIRVLKLHGSFGWRNVWPIELAPENDPGLWIAPGIRKAKTDYPFNAIWGAARELLDCDVLRIVGCNLGPNDWDLVSLIFTTMHARNGAPPYRVELIDWPRTALAISNDFPYLNVQSLLAIPDVGRQLVSEVLGGEPREYSSLTDDERYRAAVGADDKVSNPFEHWLRLKGELMLRDLPSIDTHVGIFTNFIESGS